MPSLLPLSLYCISLLFLQLNALPVGNRLDFQPILHQLKEGSTVFPDSDSSSEPTNAPAVALDRTSLWRALLYKNPPPSSQESKRDLNPFVSSVERGSESNQRSPRNRRSTHTRGHHQHAQLMRVGCVLSTCQVQKINHRFHQLFGQTGREEKAPVNPQSPHSYG
ncbi:protein ADM2a [Neoarius graeffei]|uniref:protein ADM2a n=1 Tax=Neoarius graeffei TaxID=443677 RepID=UPI00298C091B|nr:protein ADM2a [Neoarius graeffei]